MSDDRLRRRLRRVFDVEPRPGMQQRVLSGLERESRRGAWLHRPLRAVVPAAAALLFAAAVASAAALHAFNRQPSAPAGAPPVAVATPTPAAQSGGSRATSAASTSVSASSSSASGSTGVVTPHTASIPTATPTPHPTPTLSLPPGTVELTASDNGKSLQITSGTKVWVVLQGNGQQYQGFTTPQSSDSSVLRADGAACSAPSGYFCTEFLAVSAGHAQLSSTWDPACRQATPPCMAASQVWRVDLSLD